MLFESAPDFRRNGFFPLWQYASRKMASEKEAGRDTSFRVLGWLYDHYRGTRRAEKVEGQGAKEYVRARVLWRLMHYERRDDHKTLDLFPFITYDTDATDGFRKFSFMWRLIRYERRRDGGLDVDLLFVPVSRGGARTLERSR
jgi:hypothetical protein